MNYTFSHVIIPAIEHVIPPLTITSDAIEQRLHALYKRLHLPLGRLELMTGIRERHAWDRPILPSEASTQAAIRLLEKLGTNFPRDQIGFLIHSSVCRDRLEPATAAYVHQALHLSPDTLFFDLSNACLGFLNALLMVAPMIESEQIKAALIVSGENGKPLLDRTLVQLEHNTTLNRNEIKPYFANLTIGSGAVAALVCHDSLRQQFFTESPVLRIRSFSACSDSEGCTLCQGDSEGSELMMETDSTALLEVGLKLAQKNWQQFLTYNQLSSEDLTHTICHQVGRRHQTLLYQALGLDLAKDFSTFSYLGNTGSVALPITLSIACEQNIFRRNERLALLGIGSGVSSLMLLAEYA